MTAAHLPRVYKCGGLGKRGVVLEEVKIKVSRYILLELKVNISVKLYYPDGKNERLQYFDEVYQKYKPYVYADK